MTWGAQAWAEDWPNPNWETFTPLRTGVKLWSPRSPENTTPANSEGCDERDAYDTPDELHDRVVLLRYPLNLL